MYWLEEEPVPLRLLFPQVRIFDLQTPSHDKGRSVK